MQGGMKAVLLNDRGEILEEEEEHRTVYAQL